MNSVVNDLKKVRDRVAQSLPQARDETRALPRREAFGEGTERDTWAMLPRARTH